MTEFTYIDPKLIVVERDKRQRRNADPGDLTDSVRRLGVLEPIIVTNGYILVAGERRLNAALAAPLTQVPIRFFSNLSPKDQRRIELEENVKRLDPPWRDYVQAIHEIHYLYAAENPEQTYSATAASLGIDPTKVTYAMRIMSDFANPIIASAATMHAAYNVLHRRDERAEGTALAEILEAGSSLFDEPELPLEIPQVGTAADSTLPLGPAATLAPAPRPEEASILHADFLQWAPSYSGPKFNFIHCDFPYGINAFGGAMSGRDKWETYDDRPDIYWELIASLATNLDNLMTADGHLMFWLAADISIQWKTIEAFAKAAPSLAFQMYPLVWHKSDNVGILPDSKRGPRRVYETALIASREDRLIVKAVSNFYACPTDKLHHASTKPEPMLGHFFQMFVDSSTKMLDPTCGSGAALRAAEALGAKVVLGLESSEEHCSNARAALRQFRAKRAWSL